MLRKLWCKIWGHKVFGLQYTGDIRTISDPLTGQPMDVPVSIRIRLDYCKRCGEDLDHAKCSECKPKLTHE